MRLQITEGDVLVAEVIADYADMALIRYRYGVAKYRKGKPCGGMVTQRADLPRWFDVPVGECVDRELVTR